MGETYYWREWWYIIKMELIYVYRLFELRCGEKMRVRVLGLLEIIYVWDKWVCIKGIWFDVISRKIWANFVSNN